MSTRFTAPLLVSSVLLLAAGCGNEPPTPGELRVTSDPDGATVLVDDVDQGRTTPTTVTDLESGTYIVTLAKEGVAYRPAEQEVTVAWGRRSHTHFQTASGAIAVDSEPAGARIVLDGTDTGEVTPHTFTRIDPGRHVVAVDLGDRYRMVGAPDTVTVEAGEDVAVEHDLALRTVVLFEGFSNVRCTGCPALAEDVHEVMHDRVYGPDRFLYVKYPGRVPYPLDPMYRSNPGMIDARSTAYSGSSAFALPSLFWMGALAGNYGSPPDDADMAARIDAATIAPVDFYVDVAADRLDDLDVRAVPVTITLVAPHAAVDLAGHVLRAVLIYDEVHTEEHFDPGGDEYHWVARQDAEVAASIGTIDAGGSATFEATLVDPDPAAFGLTPGQREVVVYVQNLSDQSVIQAGSTMLTPADPRPRPVPSGEPR